MSPGGATSTGPSYQLQKGPGTYTITASVMDSEGKKGTDTLTVTL